MPKKPTGKAGDAFDPKFLAAEFSEWLRVRNGGSMPPVDVGFTLANAFFAGHCIFLKDTEIDGLPATEAAIINNKL